MLIAVVPMAGQQGCPPADVLSALDKADRLPEFRKALEKQERLVQATAIGDCHAAAVALMVDLTLAGHATGWSWARGRQTLLKRKGTRDHSWLEAEGWAMDVGAGQRLLFMAMTDYRAWHKAHNVVLRDSDATAQWLFAENHKNIRSVAGNGRLRGSDGMSR